MQTNLTLIQISFSGREKNYVTRASSVNRAHVNSALRNVPTKYSPIIFEKNVAFESGMSFLIFFITSSNTMAVRELIPEEIVLENKNRIILIGEYAK